MIGLQTAKDKFLAGLPFDGYVASGTPAQQQDWYRFADLVRLSEPQKALIAAFPRTLNVLVVSGLWCGDCVQQVPMLRRIEQGAPGRIELRILDRDENMDLAEQVKICGGYRVPTVIFLNEDFEFLGLLGDRTLARYRAIAARKLGSSCPLPGAPVPADEVATTLQDWVNEFERIQLLLRLSPKLRERYGD